MERAPADPAVRASIPRLLFGLRTPVGPRSYLVAGLALGLLKYAVEAALLRTWSGTWMSPARFLAPVYSLRYPDTLDSRQALALALLHLPFLWIGATMTMRRALDAGLSALVGLLFFVPAVNLVLFAILALTPTRVAPPAEGAAERRKEALRRESREERASALRSALLAIATSLLIPLALWPLYRSGAHADGWSLFVAAPFVMGILAGWFHNRVEARSLGSNALVATLVMAVACGALVVCSIEGVVCVVMAMPIGLPLTGVGVVVGAALARVRRSFVQPLASVALLPLAGLLEAPALAPRHGSVTTAVEIDAPPEAVWPLVVAFPPLSSERSWLFHTGIAWPTGATIEGSGVGALRRCEFSTGTFLEPITAWEEPARLAFDVAAQPDPMRELSPWGAIRPPHLERGFRSERGEFRLIALPGGRTRLEGTTWYALDLHPAWYWRLVAEPIVGAIHRRVLEHVRALAGE